VLVTVNSSLVRTGGGGGRFEFLNNEGRKKHFRLPIKYWRKEKKHGIFTTLSEAWRLEEFVVGRGGGS